MERREPAGRTRRRRPLSRQLADLEERLEETSRRVVQLENALKAVTRRATGVSVGGPCKCGESLLIIHQQTMYCPNCNYRHTI